MRLPGMKTRWRLLRGNTISNSPFKWMPGRENHAHRTNWRRCEDLPHPSPRRKSPRVSLKILYRRRNLRRRRVLKATKNELVCLLRDFHLLEKVREFSLESLVAVGFQSRFQLFDLSLRHHVSLHDPRAVLGVKGVEDPSHRSVLSSCT